jgi:hypothetical protein
MSSTKPPALTLEQQIAAIAANSSSAPSGFSEKVVTERVLTRSLEYRTTGASVFATKLQNDTSATATGGQIAGTVTLMFSATPAPPSPMPSQVTLSAGSSICNVTVSPVFSELGSIVILTPCNVTAARAGAYVNSTSMNGFTIAIANSTMLDNSTSVSWNYMIIGRDTNGL